MKPLTVAAMLTIFQVLVACAAQATPPPPPDAGLTGLRSVSVYISETTDNDIKLYSIGSPAPCGDLTGLFATARLHIKKKGGPAQADAGELFLSIDKETQSQGNRMLYFVSLSLSQDVRLVRDPTRILSVPSTYYDARYGVEARSDAQQKACTVLKSMISNFLDLWQGWNQKL